MSHESARQMLDRMARVPENTHLLFAKRCLDRGKLWRATFYLNGARKAMLQLMHPREGVDSETTSPHSPATRLEALIGEKAASVFKWYGNGAEGVRSAAVAIRAIVLSE